jgi:hypothetical protein
LRGRVAGVEKYKPLIESIDRIITGVNEVEQELYQTKNRSGQDPLNYPIKLNNRLSALVGVVGNGDNRPTEQSVAVRNEVTGLIDVQLKKLDDLLGPQMEALNKSIRELEVPAIFPGSK